MERSLGRVTPGEFLKNPCGFPLFPLCETSRTFLFTLFFLLERIFSFNLYDGRSDEILWNFLFDLSFLFSSYFRLTAYSRLFPFLLHIAERWITSPLFRDDSFLEVSPPSHYIPSTGSVPFFDNPASFMLGFQHPPSPPFPDPPFRKDGDIGLIRNWVHFFIGTPGFLCGCYLHSTRFVPFYWPSRFFYCLVSMFLCFFVVAPFFLPVLLGLIFPFSHPIVSDVCNCRCSLILLFCCVCDNSALLFFPFLDGG